MQYSPKLKKAMEEIKDICSRYDIAALVMLHTPGHSEFLCKVDPTYSCCKLKPDGELRIKAKLADFSGDKEAQKKMVTESLEMLHVMSNDVGNIIMPLFDLTEQVSAQVGVEFWNDGGTSHNTQNN